MLNVGIQSGLVDPKHENVMGQAVWLYLWFIWRQTKSSGLVLGGMPLTYKIISERSGFSPRKIRRWMEVLKKNGYIGVSYRNYKMMCVQVLKSKKFNYKQQGLFSTADNSVGVPSPENGQWIRPKTGNGVTKNGQFKQSGSMIYIESKAEEEAPTADRALILEIFKAIKTTPFGDVRFQNMFAKEATNGAESWVDAMEHTIVACKAARITVPGRFYKLKHAIEDNEASYAFKRTPL